MTDDPDPDPDSDSDSDEDSFTWDEPAATDSAGEERDANSADEDAAEVGEDAAEVGEGPTEIDDDVAFVWEESPAEDPSGADGATGRDDGDGRDVRSEDDPDAPLGGLADELRRRRDAGSGGGGGRAAGAGDERADEPADEPVDVSERSTDPDAPLGGLADDVRKRRADREGSPETGDVFTRMEYREIESDRLWDALDAEEDGGGGGGGGGGGRGAGGEGGGAGRGEPSGSDHGPSTPVDERDVRVIPKRTCETCPHVAEPPTVACTHEGTEILELVGMDRHRVVDCPMVDDRIPDAESE